MTEHNPLKNRFDIGVIVGRFQVAELTEAHRTLINTIKDSHSQCIVLIGISPVLGTKKQPLGYTARMQMIKTAFPDVIVSHIMDTANDDNWSKTLDLTIRALCPLGSVCLYGGRESFIKSYNGRYPTFELGLINEQQGTKIREEIGKQSLDSVDFRKGAIFACQNQYPKVFPCVDIAVLRKTGKKTEVLLARRHGNSLLRFPGGFVDPTDTSYEDAALREIREEISAEVDNDSIEYVGSTFVPDWRYQGPDEKIFTSLYSVQYVYGGGVNKEEDEFESSEWVEVQDENIEELEPNHQVLFRLLINHLRK